MIRTPSPLAILFALLVATPATTIRAQGAELAAVSSQFALLEATLATDGFQLHASPVTGSLVQGGSDRRSLELAAGVSYQIIGVCDNDCTDLDLALHDPTGEPVAEDVLDDDVPIIGLVAPKDGVYDLEVAMVSCSVEPCACGAQLYRASEATGSSGDGSTSQARPSGNSRFQGALSAGDARLADGSFYDTYGVDVREGQTLTVDLTSDQFDTYLLVRSPSGREQENDDHLGSTGHSRLQLHRPEPGSWTIVATSYGAEMEGSYTVDVTLGDSGLPSFAQRTRGAAGQRHEVGSLSEGDLTLPGGEYVDEFTFTGNAGEEVSIDLRSSDFDTYLIVRGPDGLQEDNDDHEGSANRSLVRFPLPTDGDYTVGVTSYGAEETGDYDLTIYGGLVTASSPPMTHRGSLGPGDETLRSGEYVDEYTFEATPGEAVRVDLSSDDFDTYVMVVGPGDFRQENDDADGVVGRSRVEAELTEGGTHRVLVTSYRPDEAGAYEVQIHRLTAPAFTEPRELRVIEPDQTASGILEDGDGRLESGEYRDLWAFEGDAGQSVNVEVTSEDFDTYLMLLSPDGDVLDENDDVDGRTDLSRIEARLPRSGRYRVVTTSYAAGEAGAYALTLRAGDGTGDQGTAHPGDPDPTAGQVFGIFVGVSDYGGRASNLAYTAEDAHRAAEAMIAGGGMPRENAIVLTDAEATVDNVRGAFARMGQRVDADDTFVYFYSGHGARVPRSAPERSDPDALDETIELYDGTIRDNEMSDLLSLVEADLSLVVLDACFSGGFSKDIISVPGRMGFFSSEEDVTSQVAAKFRAGGYLAQFVFDGVGERHADADGDGAISAIELSQYIHERYRFDVKSAAPDDYVRTGGPQIGFQHFVADRGSIAPDRVIFR